MKKITMTFAVLIASSLFAQVGLDKVAQSTMNFQLVSVSARASAMGEAFVSVGKGSEAVFFNPAMLRQNGSNMDAAAYSTQWIADIAYRAISMRLNMGSSSAIALHFMNVDYGEIRSTSLVSPAESGDYPVGYIDNGLMDNVGASSVGLSYARNISTQFSIGGTMRLASQNLGQTVMSDRTVNNNAKKIVFDAGVSYANSDEWLNFAMSIRNFSSNIKREVIYERLPLLFSMGMSFDLISMLEGESRNDLIFALDFQHPNNFSERVNLGAEYCWQDLIFLRAGYQHNRDLASWSAGAGIKAPLGERQFHFDYAYSPMGLFSDVHRFAISVNM